MKTLGFLLGIGLLIGCALPAGAVTYRCEQDGAVTYRDRPCGETMGPNVQQQAEQEKRSQQALKQLREDNRAIDERLRARAQREAAGRRTGGAAKPSSKRDKPAQARKNPSVPTVIEDTEAHRAAPSGFGKSRKVASKKVKSKPIAEQRLRKSP